jgi:hypothetical protein
MYISDRVTHAQIIRIQISISEGTLSFARRAINISEVVYEQTLLLNDLIAPYFP